MGHPRLRGSAAGTPLPGWAGQLRVARARRPAGGGVAAVRTYFAAYAAVHLIAATVFGSRWSAVGDGFEVYSTMVGTLSPLGRRGDGRLVARNPLDGLVTIGPLPGLVAVVAVLLGSTGFDSVSRSPAWVRLAQGTGMSPVLVDTLGLGVMIALVAVTFAGAALLAGRLGQRGRMPLPATLAHTIVPIIAGYVVAHYFSFPLSSPSCRSWRWWVGTFSASSPPTTAQWPSSPATRPCPGSYRCSCSWWATRSAGCSCCSPRESPARPPAPLTATGSR